MSAWSAVLAAVAFPSALSFAGGRNNAHKSSDAASSSAAPPAPVTLKEQPIPILTGKETWRRRPDLNRGWRFFRPNGHMRTAGNRKFPACFCAVYWVALGGKRPIADCL